MVGKVAEGPENLLVCRVAGPGDGKWGTGNSMSRKVESLGLESSLGGGAGKGCGLAPTRGPV